MENVDTEPRQAGEMGKRGSRATKAVPAVAGTGKLAVRPHCPCMLPRLQAKKGWKTPQKGGAQASKTESKAGTIHSVLDWNKAAQSFRRCLPRISVCVCALLVRLGGGGEGGAALTSSD